MSQLQTLTEDHTMDMDNYDQDSQENVTVSREKVKQEKDDNKMGSQEDYRLQNVDNNEDDNENDNDADNYEEYNEEGMNDDDQD